MIDSISFSYSKAALLDALEARRRYLTARDKREVLAHKASELRVLKEFHAKCRKALTANYAKAKEDYQGWKGRLEIESVECPYLCIERLDRCIEHIKRDGRQRYAISNKGQFSELHFLLSCDDRKPEAC